MASCGQACGPRCACSHAHARRRPACRPLTRHHLGIKESGLLIVVRRPHGSLADAHLDQRCPEPDAVERSVLGFQRPRSPAPSRAVAATRPGTRRRTLLRRPPTPLMLRLWSASPRLGATPSRLPCFAELGGQTDDRRCRLHNRCHQEKPSVLVLHPVSCRSEVASAPFDSWLRATSLTVATDPDG
jgi:hypothetical protein